MRTALRHIGDGIQWASLDEEPPGTGQRRAGAHSLRHSAARHWLMAGKVPLNVVSAWLGHANVQVTLRIYLPLWAATTAWTRCRSARVEPVGRTGGPSIVADASKREARELAARISSRDCDDCHGGGMTETAWSSTSRCRRACATS